LPLGYDHSTNKTEGEPGTNVASWAIYGAGKTDVRDIASFRNVSPANVYRFSLSKLAIWDELVDLCLPHSGRFKS
jgi:hypothetical protein